jgi:hypothetical protein
MINILREIWIRTFYAGFDKCKLCSKRITTIDQGIDDVVRVRGDPFGTSLNELFHQKCFSEYQC